VSVITAPFQCTRPPPRSTPFFDRRAELREQLSAAVHTEAKREAAHRKEVARYRAKLFELLADDGGDDDAGDNDAVAPRHRAGDGDVQDYRNLVRRDSDGSDGGGGDGVRRQRRQRHQRQQRSRGARGVLLDEVATAVGRFGSIGQLLAAHDELLAVTQHDGDSGGSGGGGGDRMIPSATELRERRRKARRADSGVDVGAIAGRTKTARSGFASSLQRVDERQGQRPVDPKWSQRQQPTRAVVSSATSTDDGAWSEVEDGAGGVYYFNKRTQEYANESQMQNLLRLKRKVAQVVRETEGDALELIGETREEEGVEAIGSQPVGSEDEEDAESEQDAPQDSEPEQTDSGEEEQADSEDSDSALEAPQDSEPEQTDSEEE
jgi:hypothetical protein